MGIREYFKQHPEEVDLKLQDLKMKESKEKVGFEFNVEDEITDKEWEIAKAHIKDIADFNTTVRFVSSLKIVFPEGLDKTDFSVNINDPYFKLFTTLFLDESSARRRLSEAISVKIIYPELKVSLDNQAWKIIKHLLEDDIDLGGSIREFRYVEILVSIKILFPEKFKDFKPDNVIREMLKEDILEYFRQFDMFKFIKMLAAYKIVFSDEPDDFRITDEMWNKMRSGFEATKNEVGRSPRRIEDYFNLARNLKIIAAKEIKTDHGLELIMDKKRDFKEKKSVRPERKNF